MIVNANSLHSLPLASGSIQCAVTSPPYWGLRDYGVAGQLGLEPVPDCLGWATGAPCGECYVCHMVQVFREVRRVLRPDGTCWLNLGDSYAQDSKWGGASGGKNYTSAAGGLPREKRNAGLKDKDLVGIPWRVAFALQADGWWLRSDIIWAKPNPMPESTTDRPTKAHEYLFLLAKSARYYYDSVAVAEPAAYPNDKRRPLGSQGAWQLDGRKRGENGGGVAYDHDTSTRNRRTVWTIATAPFSGAHFATFPPKLVEPCILAGTSERGCCPHCGAPWARVVERTREHGLDDAAFPKTRDLEAHNGHRRLHARIKAARDAGEPHDNPLGGTTTLGWAATCACPPHEPRPCVVLDPFAGSGTTGAVARLHGRRFVGLDLNPTYLRELALPRAEGRQTAASIATLPLFAQEAQ